MTIAVLGAYLVRRYREDHRAKKKLAEAVRLELNVPTSLHPVIDPDVCIGSGSCISACPEGKILGLVDGVATLLNASKCIGHGKCAVECPVDAIKLVFGTAERGVELPEVDEFFETSRAGVHIVGELAGMGLIKNALIQGLQVAARFKESITPGAGAGGGEGAVDVVIVGAGPAGLATAVGCRAAGLTYALLEQDTVGGTVAHYPRQKLVMTETIELPYYGPFGQTLIRKESLISSFAEVIKKADLKIHEKTKLTGINGEKDNFSIATDRGVLTGKRVVLAIGRRGTPRKMGVPGEELEKVAYRLIDARQYAGRKVLVVGGGDSALEAAIQLVEESDAEVAISYRRPEFARCRPLNKQKIDAHLKSGRVKSFMSTEILAITPDTVTLKNGKNETIPNDFVLACLGGELPNELLKSMGISIRRHLGDKAMANPALKRRGGAKRTGRLATFLFFLLGVLVVAGLTAVGIKYYLLPRGLRYQSPDHVLLKPSGLWGHGVGILATLFMLLNFVYPMRKRLRWFKGKGSIAPWLRFHVFVGIMSPIIILFHTAFQWGNQLATSTYVSVCVVVATGLVGRYIYGWVRLDADDAQEAKRLGKVLSELVAAMPAEWKDHARLRDPLLDRVLTFAAAAAPPVVADAPAKSDRPPKVDGSAKSERAPRSDAPAKSDARPPRAVPDPVAPAAPIRAAIWSLLYLFFAIPFGALRAWRGLRHARPIFLERAAYRTFCAQVQDLRRIRTKIRFHRPFKRFMTAWRSLHVVLAVVLLGLIGTHVWVSVRVGFRWIWK